MIIILLSYIISQLLLHQKVVHTTRKIKRKLSKSKKNDSCLKWPKNKNKNDGVQNGLKKTDSCPFAIKSCSHCRFAIKSHSHDCFAIKIVHFQSALPIWLATLLNKLFHWSICLFFPSPPTQVFYICVYSFSFNTGINFITVLVRGCFLGSSFEQSLTVPFGSAGFAWGGIWWE